MKNIKALSNLIVALLTIAILLFNVMQIDVHAFGDEDIFSEEIMDKIATGVVKVEACDGRANRPVKSGTGILIGDRGIVITNKSIIEDFDDFRVDNGLTRVVANISPSSDLAVLIYNRYNRTGLAIRDYSSLKKGETLYAITWKDDGYSTIVNSGKFKGLKKNGTSNYIIMEDAKYYGSAGAVLIDEDGKVLGISTNVEDGYNTYFIPISENKHIMDNKYVQFLSEFPIELVEAFDDIELEFESSSFYDGNNVKVVYNVITTTKNSLDYKIKIKEENFRNKLADYFENMVKNKADKYGIKDYSINLNFRYHVLNYKVENGIITAKKWSEPSKAVVHLPNKTKIVQKEVVENGSIIVDKSGKLSTETTISGAISKAVPGTKIIVQPGTYNESILINKDNIVISGTEGVFVETEDDNSLIIDAKNIRIEGIHFSNNGNINPDTILIKKGKPIISNSIIQSTYGTGVKVVGNSSPKLINNRIIDSTNGIDVSDNAGAIIKGNFISNNKDEGIIVSGTGKTEIKYNFIRKSGKCGIEAIKVSNLDISNNNIESNGFAGIVIRGGGAFQVKNNRIYKNGGGIQIYEDSKVHIIDNIIQENLISGIYAEPESSPTIDENYLKDDISVKNNFMELEKMFKKVEELVLYSDKDSLKGKYEEIVKASDEILKNSSDRSINWKVLYYKGLVLHELGRLEEAERCLKEAADESFYLIENDKDIRDNKLAGIYYYLGRIRMMNKDTVGAIKYLEKALNLELHREYTDILRKDTLFSSIKNTDEYYNLVGINLMIDQKVLSPVMLVKDGTVLAAYKEVSEALGAKVEWNESDKSIRIMKFDKTIILSIGSKMAKINGREIEIETAPVIIDELYKNPFVRDDSILIPVKFIAEALGQKVSFEEVRVSGNSYGPAIVIREDESKVKYTEEQKKWAVALSANINLTNRGVLHVMGGNYRSRDYVQSIRTVLKKGWNIHSREDYFKVLKWLKEDGHTQVYKSIDAQFSDEKFKELQEMVKVDEGVPFLYKFLVNNRNKLKDKGLIAWDYCRIVQITGWSYVAGYITIEEAYDISMDAARVVQKTYSSWEEMAEHYMMGYEFWSQQDRNDESTKASYRNFINQQLLENESSPYRTLPWNLSLD